MLSILWSYFLVLNFCLPTTLAVLTSDQLRRTVPALPLGLYKHLQRQERAKSRQALPTTRQIHGQISFQTHAEPSKAAYKVHFFDQLVSHDPAFPASPINATFKQRYWFDDTYYEPGGPIFLLDAGETDAEGRLPFLQNGILNILSKEFGGLGVVFEHRYYGKSMPVSNLSTDSMRFLTTSQSLQDSTYFAENIVFPTRENQNLTSSSVPWVYYGGSYAGAKAAFARHLFPDTWWGAIASSAVTEAIIDFWEYYEPIRLHAPRECVSTIQNQTILIDSLLALSDSYITLALKNLFGLGQVTRAEDFVNTISIPLGSWQARNWDKDVGSTTFFDWCDVITIKKSPPGDQSATADWFSRASSLVNLSADSDQTFLDLKRYADYTRENISRLCPKGVTQDECFGTDLYQGEGLEESDWRSWTWQFCTEWGYFMGAPPAGKRSLISSRITTNYTQQICQLAFQPGNLISVPSQPNVSLINQYGGFEIESDRLGFIDGTDDPWLYATPHSPHANNPQRKSSLSQPFELIPGGVHHWDENGLPENSNQILPKQIQKIHEKEILFVKAWLEEWKQQKGRRYAADERL